jgi:anthranilate synthase component 2
MPLKWQGKLINNGMKVLILDNYDSFTYNLVHYVKDIIKQDVKVARNNRISIEDVEKYSHILLSPGPGLPSDAGIMEDLISKYGKTKSIFGVCLGMQAIGEVFGAQLENLDKVYHGLSKPLTIIDNEETLFHGIPKSIMVGRYHSWVVKKNSIPENLKITCLDQNGLVMGLRHTEYNVRGVQFHPESVLTEYGKEMIENWLSQ